MVPAEAAAEKLLEPAGGSHPLLILGCAYGAAETQLAAQNSRLRVMGLDITPADIKFAAIHAAQASSPVTFAYGDCKYLLSSLVRRRVWPANSLQVVMYMPGKMLAPDNTKITHHPCLPHYAGLLLELLCEGRVQVFQITTDTMCSLRSIRDGPLGQAVQEGSLACASPLHPEAVGLLGSWSPREKAAYLSFRNDKVKQRGVFREVAVVTCYFYKKACWHPPTHMMMQEGFDCLVRDSRNPSEEQAAADALRAQLAEQALAEALGLI